MNFNINTTNPRNKILNIVYKLGFVALGGTLFIISGPRSWSLYPLGLMLFAGLIIWILNFSKVWSDFLNYWYLQLPPIIYFIVHLVSITVQDGTLKMLEDRLMFLLVPIFGFPFFSSCYLRGNFLKLIKIFHSGILILIILLLIRSMIIFITKYQIEIPFVENLTNNSNSFFSVYFSVFEHPTYLAMKCLWVLISYILLRERLKIGIVYEAILALVLTLSIFLLASKAGIIIWAILVIILIARSFKSAFFRIFVIMVGTPLILIFTFLAVKDIMRIQEFSNRIKSGISQSEINWINLDQRTREWYSAIQLIKEKPIMGFGLADVEERMVEEYKNQKWEVEALYRYNAHNQFLEAQMTFGIPGTLSLIWMLLTPIIFAKRLRYGSLSIYLCFLITGFLMIESMFNRQWGIMFFVLFYCMLVSQVENIRKIQSNPK